MLTAVWVAVVAFVVGVGVAVYLMLKAARLMTESSAAVARLREREDLLIDRASAAIDRAGDQLARTEAVTATVDEVTASMAELRGRITALTPAFRSHGVRGAGPSGTGPAGAGRSGIGAPGAGGVTWTAALLYGIGRAAGLRGMARFRLARYLFSQGREHGTPGAAGARRPALTGRRSGTSR